MQMIELKQVDKLQLKYFTIAVYQAGEKGITTIASSLANS